MSGRQSMTNKNMEDNVRALSPRSKSLSKNEVVGNLVRKSTMSIKNEISEDIKTLKDVKHKSGVFMDKITKSRDPLKDLGVGISTFH